LPAAAGVFISTIANPIITDYFDGQPALLAIKIEDEHSEPELPPELESLKLLLPESGPKNLLSGILLPAQRPSSLGI